VPAERIVWFSPDGESTRLREHCAAGGAAVFLRRESVVLSCRAEERAISLGEGHQGGPDELVGLLAALAAAMALDLGEEEIQAYLRSLTDSALPGLGHGLETMPQRAETMPQRGSPAATDKGKRLVLSG